MRSDLFRWERWMNFSAVLGSPDLLPRLRRQLAVALLAVEEVAAHGVARLARRLGADGVEDGLVLALDILEIMAHPAGIAVEGADALPRDDQTAEIFQKADEAARVGGESRGGIGIEIRLYRRFN